MRPLSEVVSFSNSDSDPNSVTKNQIPVDLCPQNSTAEVTLTKFLLLQACWSQAPAYFKRSVNPISTRLCPLLTLLLAPKHRPPPTSGLYIMIQFMT